VIHPPLVKFVGFDLDATLYKESRKMHEAFQEAYCKLMAFKLGVDYRKAKKEFLKYRKATSGGCEIAKMMGVKEPERFAMQASINSKMYLYLKKDKKLLNLIRYLQEKYNIKKEQGCLI